MTIDINFDDTPDDMPVVSEGVHVFEVLDVEEKEDKNGDSYQSVSMKVVEPGEEDHDRRHWERFNFKYAPARVKFKNFIRSCGHDGSGAGVDTTELIGCDCKAVVASRNYTDKDSGDQVTTTQVKKFLYDADDV